MVSNTRITVKPEHRREFFQTFATVSDNIRREEGCLSFRLFEETGHENSVILVGEWESKEAFQRHSRGENYAVLHGSVQILGIGSKTDHRLLQSAED
jgi:quinol monooxygenase YgiN